MQNVRQPNSRRSNGRLIRNGALLLGFCAFTTSGCQHGDYAQQRTEARLAGMERTADAWAESERSRPAKLERDWAYVDRELKQRPHMFERDVRVASEILSKDAERFEQRQDAYLREIWRVLWGKPEAIEKTAIDMFY